MILYRAFGIIAFALISCTGAPDGEPAQPHSSSLIVGQLKQSVVVDSVALSLTAEPILGNGDSIRFRLSARNLSRSPISFNLSQPYPVAFIVSDSSGNVVWSSTPDEALAQVGEVDSVIGPGSERVVDTVWNSRSKEGARVPAGSYAVVAVLTSNLSISETRLGAPLRISSDGP